MYCLMHALHLPKRRAGKNASLYIKLSVCLLRDSHKSTTKACIEQDFYEIKLSSSGNLKFVVINCYMLSFALYKSLV